MIKSLNFSELFNSANEAHDRYLTKAGHALQKHGNRAGSVFPKVHGKPYVINESARRLIRNILSHDNVKYLHRYHGRFGKIVDIYIPNGQGIRYHSNGQFIGFIEL